MTAGPLPRRGKRPPSRARRIVTIAALSLGGLLVAAVLGVVVWSQVGVMGAEPGPLEAIRADDRIEMSDAAGIVGLSPAGGESATTARRPATARPRSTTPT